MRNLLIYLSASLDENLVVIPKANPDSGLQTGIQLLTAVAGGFCLVFITFAGFKYVLARGRPDEIAKAKDTIIYSLVGLVISMSAYAIVTFVVNKI